MKKILVVILLLVAILLPSCVSNNTNVETGTTPIYTGMSVGNEANIKNVNLSRAGVLMASAAEITADYTAYKGNDFFITVHIDNPEEYEIISLRLNGVKYVGNYAQFETGTNAENIVIKLNAGETLGTLSYVVSDIKWINGVTIEERDVGMSAMSSDSITVLVELAMPTLEVVAHRDTPSGPYSRFVNPEGLPCEYVSVTFVQSSGAYSIDVTQSYYNPDYNGWTMWNQSGPATYTITWRYFYNGEWVVCVSTVTT
jgi:hypothetical protein